MDIWTMPVHPAAEIFDMLGSDEMAELVEDVKANGLIYPLVVKDNVLVDGRNRREACKQAGIEPRTEELNGMDPLVYILAANIKRRHMSKGAQAMAVARMYPETMDPKESGAGKRSVIITDLNAGAISHARTVLKFLPATAALVMSGAITLHEAYKEALAEKRRAEREPELMARLEIEAPDLAELVKEEKMTLNEAVAALEQRLANDRASRSSLWKLLSQLSEHNKWLHFESTPGTIVAAVRDFPNECPVDVASMFEALAERCAVLTKEVENGTR